MSRLDLTLRKHPEHEEGIRLLASRDPSGNLKYLDWGAGVLASGQALAPEIAGVIELFHEFKGQTYVPGRRRNPLARRRRHRRGVRYPGRVHPDLYIYKPHELAKLRDLLLKMKRARDRKRRERERLYKIEGAIDADVVYESDTLIVRHIKNKAASVHHGLNTRWCISMLREEHFESYEAENAVFFFFERKPADLRDDAFNKVTVMLSRDEPFSGSVWTADDERVDMMVLAKVYGTIVFDILKEIYERSLKHPTSVSFRVKHGAASAEQLETVYAEIVERAGKNVGVEAAWGPYEIHSGLVHICCNDAAPWPLLERVVANAETLYRAVCASLLRRRRRRGVRRAHRRVGGDAKVDIGAREITRDVRVALVLHPNTPEEVRAELTKVLRRGRVRMPSLRRTWAESDGRVGISYTMSGGNEGVGAFTGRRSRRRRLWRSYRENPNWLIRHAGVLERRAVRFREKAKRIVRKQKVKAAKTAARKAKKAKKVKR